MVIRQIPDYNTPNKKKRFVEAERRRTLRSIEQVSSGFEAYLSKVYGIRRQKAILNFMDRAEAEFGGFGLNSVVESFTKNELTPFSNYNHLDEDFDLRIGAALWILEKVRAGGKIAELYDILPDMSGEIDDWYLPADFAHPCFSNDLIRAVIQVISTRYGKRRDVVITQENAGGKKPGEAYTKLLSLIPEEEIQKACGEFKTKVWELAMRFMKCQGYYDSELKKFIQEMVKTAQSQNPGAFAGPLAELQVHPAKGSPLLPKPGDGFLMDGSPLMGVGTGLNMGQSPMDIVAVRARELNHRFFDYVLNFDRYLWMDRKAVRRETGSRDVAEAMEGFTVADPYQLCFALFYLMDTDDDAPWLMRSGSSLMLYALRMLPWYMEQEDWDDEKWDDWYDGFHYNRNCWMQEDRPEEQIDFYHEMHNGRNLAQVIYDLCRTVVPTGLHPFEKDREQLVAEGMDENLARKITDTAEILFLYEFQAKQMAEYDLSWEEERDTVSEPAEQKSAEKEFTEEQKSAEQPRPGGYWARMMGKPVEEDLSTVPEAEEKEDTSALKAELDAAKVQLKSLRNALAVTKQNANNERAKYEHELKALRMEHRELADLRELVFNSELSEEEQRRREQPVKNYSYPYSTRKRTVVFGGHDSFLRAIKPMLPDVRFVDAGKLTYSSEVIRNSDVVWIQNNCISHPQFWSIVKNCKLAGVQMRYFGFASAEKCAEQLVEWDQK